MNLQQKVQLQLEQMPKPSFESTIKESSSQKRNIEHYLSKSNKYSKDCFNFLQEKNTLLIKQQSQSQQQIESQKQHQTTRYSHEKQVDGMNSEVNKIYEIRTQFNKFEEDRIILNGILEESYNLGYNNQVVLSREDQLVETNSCNTNEDHFKANEDLDEVQETEQFTVSSKMRTLQNCSKQTYSIQKVEQNNRIQPLVNEIQNSNALDLHQNNPQQPVMPIIHSQSTQQQLQQNIMQPTQLLHSNQNTLQNVLQSFSNQQQSLQSQQQPLQNKLQLLKNQNQQYFQNEQHQMVVQDQSQYQTMLKQENKTQQSQTILLFNAAKNQDSNGVSLSQQKGFNQRNGVNYSQLNTERSLRGSSSTQSIRNVKCLGYALNLINRGLEDLSKYFTQMNPNTLQILDLSSNRFSNIPLEICKMSNLKRLKLENNLIKTLPTEIFSQLRLEFFSLQNNLISDIPPEISEWKGCLQGLNISKNHINTFQKYLCSLEGLTSLNVSSNDFTEIPIEFIFLTNLKEFSIDWFKYCLPPRKPTVQGTDGHSIIRELFILLCLHHNAGFVNFLQFTTHFSDANLIKISASIKKSRYQENKLNIKNKLYIQNKFNIKNKQNLKNKLNVLNKQEVDKKQGIFNCQNILNKQWNGRKLKFVGGGVRSEDERKQLVKLNEQESDEDRFVLNISNMNMLNRTTSSSSLSSLTDSILPKETEGIQLLPSHLTYNSNNILMLFNNHKQDDDDDCFTKHKIESHLTPISPKNIFNSPLNQTNMQLNNMQLNNMELNNMQLNTTRQKVVLQPSLKQCNSLIKFSSDSDIHFDEEEDQNDNQLVVRTQNDLTISQQKQKEGKGSPSSHNFRGKKHLNNLDIHSQQITERDENFNFYQILQEEHEEKKEQINNEMKLDDLDQRYEKLAETLLSQQREQSMKRSIRQDGQHQIKEHKHQINEIQHQIKEDVQNEVLDEQNCFQDQADEIILSESQEEQEEKPKSAQFLNITSPKIYTQYNQINPKNGRNLLHLVSLLFL